MLSATASVSGSFSSKNGGEYVTVSHLEPKALRRMSSQAVADMALFAFHEARRLRKAGKLAEAAEWDAEWQRLCDAISGEAA